MILERDLFGETYFQEDSEQKKEITFAIERSVSMVEFEIPKQCKAGVVVNEGPDFKVEMQMVDVPEPGKAIHALRLHHGN